MVQSSISSSTFKDQSNVGSRVVKNAWYLGVRIRFSEEHITSEVRPLHAGMSQRVLGGVVEVRMHEENHLKISFQSPTCSFSELLYLTKDEHLCRHFRVTGGLKQDCPADEVQINLCFSTLMHEASVATEFLWPLEDKVRQ